MHCVESLNKTFYPLLVLVHTRKTSPDFTKIVELDVKNQNKQNKQQHIVYQFIILRLKVYNVYKGATCVHFL